MTNVLLSSTKWQALVLISMAKNMSTFFMVTFRSADWQRRPVPGDTGGRVRACRPLCPGRSGSCAVCRARMLPLLRRRSAGPARPVGRRAPLAGPARPVGTVHPAGTGSTHPAATGIFNQIVKLFYLFGYFIVKEQKMANRMCMRDKMTFPTWFGSQKFLQSTSCSTVTLPKCQHGYQASAPPVYYYLICGVVDLALVRSTS